MLNNNKNSAAVPSREQLLASLSSANRIAWIWLLVQAAILVAVIPMIDWRELADQPIVSIVLIGVVVGPTFTSAVMFWAGQKKEIGDLKEQTRFGPYDKHKLRRLFDETVEKLGLPRKRIPVYITADKCLNASAVNVGLLSFWSALNGIYLNRQLLHRLEPEEVQDIMGHELGHYYKHYLVTMRADSLTILVGALVGMWVAQQLDLFNSFGIIASLVIGGAFGKLSGLLWAQHGPTVEYLCDDLGAQVNGVHWSISGLMKLGADGEMQSEIYQQAILSRKHGSVSPREIVESIEKATPYGDIDPEELSRQVDRMVKSTASDNRGVSVGGFLDYLWNSEKNADIDEQIEDQAKTLAAMASVPRIDWESTLPNPNRLYFDMESAQRLVELIEREPDKVLFRLPTETGAVADVHPPLRDRVLYLWKNRAAIEQAAKDARRGA